MTLVLPGAATDARAITGGDTAAATAAVPDAGPETGGTVAVPVADALALYGLLDIGPVFDGCELVELEPPAPVPPAAGTATTGTKGDALGAIRTVGSGTLASSASTGAGATFPTGVGNVAGSGTGTGVGLGAVVGV